MSTTLDGPGPHTIAEYGRDRLLLRGHLTALRYEGSGQGFLIRVQSLNTSTADFTVITSCLTAVRRQCQVFVRPFQAGQ